MPVLEPIIVQQTYVTHPAFKTKLYATPTKVHSADTGPPGMIFSSVRAGQNQMAVTTITTLRKMKLTAGAVSIVPSIISSVYCHTVSPNVLSHNHKMEVNLG